MIRAVPPFALLVACLAGVGAAAAQPAASFRVRCGDLREAIRKLAPADGEPITIQIVGPLTLVKSSNVVTYLGLCAAPDPKVLCVTYDANGRRQGDVAMLSGNLVQNDPDHLLLDPCLNFAADGAAQQ